MEKKENVCQVCQLYRTYPKALRIQKVFDVLFWTALIVIAFCQYVFHIPLADYFAVEVCVFAKAIGDGIFYLWIYVTKKDYRVDAEKTWKDYRQEIVWSIFFSIVLFLLGVYVLKRHMVCPLRNPFLQ